MTQPWIEPSSSRTLANTLLNSPMDWLMYIYMDINKEINPTVWRKVEKQNNPKFNEFIMKVNIEQFSRNKLLQDFKFMKSVVKTAMEVWGDNGRKENVYKKRLITAHSTSLVLKILLCCWNMDRCLKFIKFWIIWIFQLFYIYIYIW